MTMPSRRTTPWLTLLAGSALSVWAAKEPPAPPAEANGAMFIDTVNVAVVNVDVYVTDKKGNRVMGLSKDDFEILENKRPVAISNFSVIESGKLTRQDPPLPPEEPETEPSDLPPGVTLARQPEPPPLPEDHRLHLVVYIDNFNLQPFSRNRVMRELRDFLRNKLDKNDRVMLVSYDRELHVRRPWTSDAGSVASALQDLETVSGMALSRISDRKDALERIDESESPQGAESFAQLYAENVFSDLNFSIDALREVVNGLAGIPGRKAVLYVSEGLPMIAGQDLYYAVQQKFAEGVNMTDSFRFDLSRRFQELTSSANANRVTFYTIDAGGLRSMGLGDASVQNSAKGNYLGTSTMIEQINIQNSQSSLQMMAEETGGKAIINANRITDALNLVSGDFDNFYSLGYSPAHFGDGRYYELQVRVKGKKDLVVRHREGYRDKPLAAQMSDGTMAALMHGFESNRLGIKLEFGAAERNKDDKYLVPVNVSIPLGRITLVPNDVTYVAKLRLFVAALDGDGGISEVQEQEVPISIPTAEIDKARKQWYLYSMKLLMRDGPHRVSIGLRDDVSAESSFITGQLNVGG